MNTARCLAIPLILFLLTSISRAGKPDLFYFSPFLGTLEFKERTDYPEEALGYSLRYENDKLLKADIYVYNMGQQDLKDGINSPEVKAEMASVGEVLQKMEKMGKYEGVELLQEGIKESHPSGLKFLWSRYRLRQIGGAEVVYLGKRISDTFLMVCKGKFIKIRITTKESDLTENDKEIERFVNQVGSCLK